MIKGKKNPGHSPEQCVLREGWTQSVFRGPFQPQWFCNSCSRLSKSSTASFWAMRQLAKFEWPRRPSKTFTELYLFGQSLMMLCSLLWPYLLEVNALINKCQSFGLLLWIIKKHVLMPERFVSLQKEHAGETSSSVFSSGRKFSRACSSLILLHYLVFGPQLRFMLCWTVASLKKF